MCQCVHVCGGVNMSGVSVSMSGVSASMSGVSVSLTVVVSTCLVSLSLARPHWPWPGRRQARPALGRKVQGATREKVVTTQWGGKIQSSTDLERNARNRCRKKKKKRSHFCFMLSLKPGVWFKLVRSGLGDFSISEANNRSR